MAITETFNDSGMPSSQLLAAVAAGSPLGMISREGDKLLAVRAAMHGVDAALSALLGRDVSPNTTEDNAATLLVLAAAGGHVKAVETLLQAGADVHQRDNDARTPLRAAMQANSLECVTLLLAAGADPGLGDLYGTPSTTDHGFSQQCDLAIAAAIDEAYQKFLLIHAALDGDENKVAGFLSRGEPVNVFNHDGVTALTCACNQKHPNVVRLLLEHGADPNLATTKDQTPIGLSISKGDAECVKILLKAGAAPGPVALHQACGKKYADVAKVLLDNGADPNVTARSTKYFPEPADFYISMLGVHADDYPLHTAIKNRDVALATVLARAGARTVAKDAEGVTALRRGRECGSEEIWDIIRTRHEQEMEALATSAVTLDDHTTPLRTLKFKLQGPD